MSQINGSSPFLYPQVTRIPGQNNIGGTEQAKRTDKKGPGDFDLALENELGKQDLSQVREPLKFSAHASQRLSERKIQFTPEMMSRISDAVDKAAAKGVDDTLVLTPDAALIVSSKNRTVITAMDRNSMSGNVFTNIDGAVIV